MHFTVFLLFDCEVSTFHISLFRWVKSESWDHDIIFYLLNVHIVFGIFQHTEPSAQTEKEIVRCCSFRGCRSVKWHLPRVWWREARAPWLHCDCTAYLRCPVSATFSDLFSICVRHWPPSRHCLPVQYCTILYNPEEDSRNVIWEPCLFLSPCLKWKQHVAAARVRK